MDPIEQRVGVLLVQLGTPASTSVGDVRRYLREFLSDPRVIDISAPARWLLVNAIIAPFRAPRSAAAYRAIWSEQGSPLLVHSRALAKALGRELGAGFQVDLGMRYGAPHLADALERLVAADVSRILALPLFPQYASSSTGSAAAAVLRWGEQRWNVPPLHLLGDFHDRPQILDAVAAVARPALERFRPDHVLFSYHGLPERQIRRSDPSGRHCLARENCCDAVGPANRFCYRAQCFATSRALRERLSLAPETTTTSFQSRLGRTPWILPHTDRLLPELARGGVRRLAVLCPSFVADCLETLEEIGIRAREQWRQLGGEELLLVPCPNSSPVWVTALAALIREAANGAAPGGDRAVAS